ncbi:hypothetical protein J31TS4_20450 [Paenibacillus sp. J31TS4]|uniref:exo-beta-N-acetylmuramidase NamZ family protein n=1 Tax=Paenibacillus sp. J31TS4 TaxID=2807195 RepID=UPI001B224DA5|nr:DUF1343 domain-containing protein [Paenibacillus sp. J31TS4]GIP38765.1 hypothetical protein J31TS4_20450 [Paenibacillus sp. J31TS4]
MTMAASKVWTGADRLRQQEPAELAGKRIGLLTNPTGRTADLLSVVDVCASLPTARLTALYACEHGINGERQAGVTFEDETDERLGIPVYSLYGKTRKPTGDMLEGIDALIFDIQDLGVRFYTYLSTLVYAMEACAEHGKELIVLDRPNPLGGVVCEGGFLQDGYQSMVGAWPIPFRTGLTIGEFARYLNDQLTKPVQLTVLAMEGWTRGMEYTDTGLPWIFPSPNMPTMDTVRVYSGNCLFEGTNLSEGRGTTKPFELIGAPWLDGQALSDRLNALGLPGVGFCPMYFTPTFSKHQGAICGGVHLFVTDRQTYRPAETALHMLKAIQQLHPDDFAWLPPFKEGRPCFIDLLTGSDLVRTQLHTEGGLERIIELWRRDAEEWSRTRQPYLLYGEE